MKILERLQKKTETADAKLWREYREILGKDSAKDAPRLSELLVALELTPKHAEFHRQVLAEAKAMAADAALLEPARKDYAAATDLRKRLDRACNEAMIAAVRQQDAESKLMRRTIVLAERESDLAHLHHRFPELLGETKAVSEFPDSPSARLQNLARDLGLPRLISAEG